MASVIVKLSAAPVAVRVAASPVKVTVSGARGPRGYAGSSAWADITGRPLTFPPTIGAGATDAVAGNDPRLSDPRPIAPRTYEDATIIIDGGLLG